MGYRATNWETETQKERKGHRLGRQPQQQLGPSAAAGGSRQFSCSRQ